MRVALFVFLWGVTALSLLFSFISFAGVISRPFALIALFIAIILTFTQQFRQTKLWLIGSIIGIVVALGWIYPVATMKGSSETSQAEQYWKVFGPDNGGQWQINHAKPVENDSNIFKWTIYAGIGTNNPDYTYWTTKMTWQELSQEAAKKELGEMWQLVPDQNFYFYELKTPGVAWVVHPATMEGVQTSIDNHNNLVESTLFRRTTDPVVFLANQPIQLTSVDTDTKNQTITFVWEPLKR